MAKLKKQKKGKDVAKFGGTEELGNVKLHGYDHDSASVEVQSQTKLEQDEGYGNVVVVRQFTFGMNPEAFKLARPTKQDIFNAHYKGIEIHLWKDGWKVEPDINPRIVVNPEKMQYTIFVSARPMKGQRVLEKPLTMSEVVNG